MRKQQENRFTMIITVITYLERFFQIVNRVPELEENLGILKTKKAEISIKDERKKTALTGKTLTKQQAKDNAVKSAMAVSGALFAYGKKITDHVIIERSSLIKSELDRMRDTELAELLESLNELATEKLNVLGPYGISEARLNLFAERIESLNKALGDKEDSGVARSGAVKSLNDLFKEADQILLSMDKLVIGLNEDEPEFVRDYNTARKVKNLGLRHRKPEEQIPDEGTNSPPDQSQES